MELTRQHLVPIFEHIVELLGPAPGQLEQFEPWAKEQTVRLRLAAERGRPSIGAEAALLREELALMTRPEELDQVPTERTARMRLCQRLWLTGLLDFVDDLLETPDALVPWAV